MRIAADGITLDLDPRGGQIAGFAVTDAGRVIAPLHRAPWVGTDEAMPADAAPLMARLGGDFFCAPFALSEGASPLHGWPANADWDATAAGDRLTAVLSRPVMGAVLTKRLRLRDGHPFVYQAHAFSGGAGATSFANHANVAVANGAWISTSAKRHWETPAAPLEGDPARGRSALVCPATGAMAAFPGLEGPVDLRRYPWAPAHEDFVAGIEAPGHRLGWTAVVRAEGDVYLSLRDPARLPMTMLWHSNGGRDYAPWSGRHRGCLGVEEGAAAHMLGLSPPGVLTGPGTLALGGVAEVRHVTGAIAWPAQEPVATVELDGCLRITGAAGTQREVPFDAAFLWPGADA